MAASHHACAAPATVSAKRSITQPLGSPGKAMHFKREPGYRPEPCAPKGAQRIEQSGAPTLYDYFAQHTSLQVLPSYGNKASPKIDMRGYGIGDGYQNIVVTLDGRRLNNIDMGPQLLGAIPLGDIE